MSVFPREFIDRIPKTDLHVHLDGSLRLSTLIELARESGVNLPSFTEQGLCDLVFKSSYANLDEYLSGFAWTVRVLQTPEALERVAYELALDSSAEGVRHLEVRFAPQLHMRGDTRAGTHPRDGSSMRFEDVMAAVDRGLRRARGEINTARGPGQPEFDYGIIVTAMRFFTRDFSAYYRTFCDVHAYSPQNEIIRAAAIELARATVALCRSSDIQIVAFDLAGSEHGYPAGAHEEAFDFIHENFLKKTVHAGEAYGPESIFQAITKLHADRIGHGLRLFDTEMINSPEIADRAEYVRGLANFIADRRTTIEVCLTSNLQTAPDITDISKHSLGRMLENKLSITLCTDNRLVSHTTVTREILLAIENFAITPKMLKHIIVYGFKRSFSYKPYPEKRQYVRSIIDYYERLERKYGVTEDAEP